MDMKRSIIIGSILLLIVLYNASRPNQTREGFESDTPLILTITSNINSFNVAIDYTNKLSLSEITQLNKTKVMDYLAVVRNSLVTWLDDQTDNIKSGREVTDLNAIWNDSKGLLSSSIDLLEATDDNQRQIIDIIESIMRSINKEI